MAKKDINYENNIDLGLNEIKNVVVEVVDALPSTVTEGRIISLAGDLYIGKGSKYVKLGDAGDVDSLKTRMTTAEGKITTLEGEMDTAQADITAIKTSDYATSGITAELVTKLTGIEAGAEVNVQADWSQTTTTADDYIKNKPTLGTASALDAGTSAGNVPVLDSNGKLVNSVIPPLAIGDLAGTVDAKSKLTTLSNAEKGDIAKVEGDSTVNNNGVYFLTGAYDTLANWIQIVGPSNVVSVNGESGVVVLDASDVGAIDASYGPKTSIADSDAEIPTSKAIYTALSGKVDKLSTKPTAGEYTKVTINAEGQVTAGANLVASDIPDIAESQVTGLTADLASKLDDSQLVTSFGATPSDSNIASEKLVKDSLDTKVDKVSGKGLSTNDYTTAEKEKLAGIASGAQVNVIETVKVNGTAQTVTSKAVDITVPTKTSDITNDSDFQTGTEVDSAIETALGSYYTKTAIQGFFTSQSISTASDGSGGFVATVNITKGTPFMAQVLDGDGNVVVASITIGSSSVTVNTNKTFTGILKVLALPN